MAIYFGCPDKDYPVGGIRAIYRQVDILNRNGFEAFVLHRLATFRCTWFENETRIAYELRYAGVSRSLTARVERRARRSVGRLNVDPLPALELDRHDILVVPEVMPGLAEIAPNSPKVIFNQNAYLTFAPYPLDAEPDSLLYRSPEVLAAIVVSDDSRRYLETVFPDLPVRRVHYGIDPRLFAYAPRKRRQIAYMPRKNPRDLHEVLSRLRVAGRLHGWDLVEISNRSEGESAGILRESAVFLSAAGSEGFGLPAAEAMCAGWVVVGYHGNGGREFLTDDLAFPVPAGEVGAFADTVAGVLAQVEQDSTELTRRVEAASRFISETYSPEREERDVVGVWAELAKRSSGSASAAPASSGVKNCS
jgi:glycosyltransferase involved in cell wall biosynthesis